MCSSAHPLNTTKLSGRYPLALPGASHITVHLDQRSHLHGCRHSALFESRRRAETFWRVLKKAHPVLCIIFGGGNDGKGGRVARSWKLFVELLIFASGTAIAAAFERKYAKPLRAMIKSECSGDHRRLQP